MGGADGHKIPVNIMEMTSPEPVPFRVAGLLPLSLPGAECLLPRGVAFLTCSSPSLGAHEVWPLMHWDDPKGWYGEGGGRRRQWQATPVLLPGKSHGENQRRVWSVPPVTVIFLILRFLYGWSPSHPYTLAPPPFLYLPLLLTA